MVEGIHGMAGVSPIGTVGKTQGAAAPKRKLQDDEVAFLLPKSKIPVDKQKEIIKAARSNASGWAVFGSIFSTLYYGLRSDDTIAEKYDLDPKTDRSLIKQIKREQMLWTLPSCIPGLGIIPAVAAWLYNKTMDENSIHLDGYLR